MHIGLSHVALTSLCLGLSSVWRELQEGKGCRETLAKFCRAVRLMPFSKVFLHSGISHLTFACSFIRQTLNIYHVPGTVLGTRVTMMNLSNENEDKFSVLRITSGKDNNRYTNAYGQ